jgi:hypothetical protein
MEYTDYLPVVVAVCGMALRIALFFPRRGRRA